MFHRKNGHDHRAPVGIILGKLALGIAAAVIKKKIEDRMASKQPPPGPVSESRVARPVSRPQRVRRFATS